MNKVFLIKQGLQDELNEEQESKIRYQIENKEYWLSKNDFKDRLSGMDEGDYGFLQSKLFSDIKNDKSEIKRLWRMKQVEEKEEKVVVHFDEVFVFDDIKDIFFNLDLWVININLCNYAIKQNKGVVFVELSLVDDSEFLDIVSSKERFDNYIKNPSHLRRIELVNDQDDFTNNTNNIQIYVKDHKCYINDQVNFIDYQFFKVGGFEFNEDKKNGLLTYIKNRKNKQPSIRDLYDFFNTSYSTQRKLDRIGEYKDFANYINNDKSSREMVNLENKYSIRLQDINDDEIYQLINRIEKEMNTGELEKRDINKKEKQINLLKQYMNYRNGKTEMEKDKTEMELENKYCDILKKSKNIILHGAPGTGKTFLANKIATMIITDGQKTNPDELSDEEKKRKEFVQFHPSYDYTDFVEGIRPNIDNSNNVGFEYRKGIFKKFVETAIDNYENAKKDPMVRENEENIKNTLLAFLNNHINDRISMTTKRGQEFYIDEFDFSSDTITIRLTNEDVINREVKLKISRLAKLLENKEIIAQKDVTEFFGSEYGLSDTPTRNDSYYYSLYNEIQESIKKQDNKSQQPKPDGYKEKKYVFIIDEINRGEISKILGELFFCIDPGYRGKKEWGISTQYSNMMEDDKKFYIPDNVYIIGTMNDIDRSVDTFDFAMRRRFRFVEVEPKDTQNMLDELKPFLGQEGIKELKDKMDKINEFISKNSDLGSEYQIGASYFKKEELIKDDKTFDYESLWFDYLKPLIFEYVRGMGNNSKLIDDIEDIIVKQSLEPIDESMNNEDEENMEQND